LPTAYFTTQLLLIAYALLNATMPVPDRVINAMATRYNTARRLDAINAIAAQREA